MTAAATDAQETQPIRSLFLTLYAPYPPTGGAPLRNWQNINALMALGPVAVFSISKYRGESIEDRETPPGLALWEHHQTQQRSFIDKLWDKVLQWAVPERIPGSPLEANVSRKLEEIIRTFQPDLVIFEELWLNCYLPVVQQFDCQVIFDGHNVEAPLHLDNQNKSGTSIDTALSALTFRKIKAAEQQMAQQAAQVWLCSQDDVDVFAKLYDPSAPLCVVPNGIDVGHYHDVRAGTSPLPEGLATSQHVLVFVGRYSYSPNAVAAHLLIEEIFPRLQVQYSDCSLLLVGSSPTPQMLSAAQAHANITVTNRVEDVRPYLALATVVIVPLLEGGGTRLKILEAFAAGRPVVSTTKGAEGLLVEDGQHLLIRDGVDQLVSGVDDLWSDSSLRADIAEKAYQLVQRQYSWEANGQVIADHLQQLQ